MAGAPFRPRGAGGGGGGPLEGDAGGGAGFGRDAETVVFVRLSDGSVAGQASLGFDGPTGHFEMRLPLGDQYAAYVSAPGFAGIGQVIESRPTRNRISASSRTSPSPGSSRAR